jgi:disulfide bond formation protein DsbB
MSLTHTISVVLAVGSLAALALGTYVLLRNHIPKRVALWMAFIGALIATLGSLYYSEIAGFEPCRLCWFQRIFMYPLVLILGMSLWRKHDASDYVLGLSIPGFLIAAYQWVLQMRYTFSTVSDSCSATGVSCAAPEFMIFGFVSIPFLSLVMFLLLIVLGWTMKRHKPL